MTTSADKSIDVGRTVLAAIMARPEFLFSAKKHIKAEDFAKGIDQNCWNKIISLEAEGKAHDHANVCDENFPDSLPIEILVSWPLDYSYRDIAYFESRVVDFVNLVDRERSCKALNVLTHKISVGELKDSYDIATEVNGLALKIYKLHPRQTGGYAGTFVYDDLKELEETGKSGIPFGIASIDAELNGMNKGQFILIAARPGVGKSSLFLYPLYEHCKLGKHVCLNTMEMTRPEMTLRIIANRSSVMMDKIQGKVASHRIEAEKVAAAIDEIKKWKLTIVDQGMNTTTAIDNFLTQSAAETNPVELLILDHFGYLMPNSGKIYNRYSDYTTISNELKRLAKKHRCLIICLTQLNRIDQYTRPTLESMRDTGSLEQDADKIIALWRDPSSPRNINVGVIKNRQGTTFETQLKFYGSSMQYYETKEVEK